MPDFLKFRYWAKLQVSLPLTTTHLLHPIHEFVEITGIIQERLTMVGERERHQARSCEPTRNAAHNDAVFKSYSRGCSCDDEWLVPICAS
jgi:hypothetical protein